MLYRSPHSLAQILLLLLPLATVVNVGRLHAETWLVQEGQPRAQIVIAPNPPRAVPVAARQLQTCLKSISGATVPIVSEPDSSIPLRIYVGRSSHTDALGLAVDDLEHGAYRIASGSNWLALLGRDSNYVFREPYPRSLAEKDELQSKWEKLTGHAWIIPFDARSLRHYSKDLDLWYLDERGSINAVCRFLEDLGARWYMPGELGQILPRLPNIALPEVNRTVKPDFALRNMHSRMFFSVGVEEALWALRLGWNQAPQWTGPYISNSISHGISLVATHPENAAAHPEFFVLLNGKRFMAERNPSYCYSSEELFNQNVAFVRAVFDTYDVGWVSVQPADGMVLVCQCPKCEGKATPERGTRGIASDYVWEYVDRVAREIYKSHPTKKISALAYANYLLPPLKIQTLSPNIVLGLPSGRTFTHNQPDQILSTERIVEQWIAKLPQGPKQTFHYEYLMDARLGRTTVNLPVFVTASIARSLRNVKGHCVGESIDLERYRNSPADLGINHLNVYVTSKLWWNADLDLASLLEEYYTLYYGPARQQMKDVIEFSEANWTRMSSEASVIRNYFQLLQTARDAAPADSVYAKRIDLLWQYTKPMEATLAKLEKGRDQSVPPIVLRGPRPNIAPGDITIDGKLDESVWADLPVDNHLERQNLRSYVLKDLITGQQPKNNTRFKVFYSDNALYLGIRCDEPDIANLSVATRKNDDQSIWTGDLIEVHLETQDHSYYAMAVNPAGALADLDWKDRKRDMNWNSRAEAAAFIGENFWSVEIRIPIVNTMEADIVELGQSGVSGRKPIFNQPWYMNLVRQRVRGQDKELTAYSPTGTSAFHDPLKFARLSFPEK